MRDRPTRLAGGALAPVGLAHRESGTRCRGHGPAWTKGKDMSCALRALNLCDGRVLEDTEHRLTECPHQLLQAAEEMRDEAAWSTAHEALWDALTAAKPSWEVMADHHDGQRL